MIEKILIGALEKFREEKPDGFGIFHELLLEFLPLYCVYLEENMKESGQ